jgi:hypothetical protein
MPVERVTSNGRPGYRWGKVGKIYLYTPGSATSRARAYALAARQGQAAGAEDEPTWKPPAAVAAVARRALEERAKRPASQRGMTAVGIARARDLSNRRPVSLTTIERMNEYFSRHEIDKQGSTWATYGKGRQAWDGWGGDPGRAWAAAILRSLTSTTAR